MKSRLIILISLLAVVFASGCVGQQTAEPPAGANEVIIRNTAFNPPTLTVSVGTTVKWTNEDTVPHTVTSNSGLFDSGTLSRGQSFSHTFNQAGTFEYHCSIHTPMKAKIIVE